MKSILDILFETRSKTTEEDTPEFIQNKKYRLCTEDNPDETHYRCRGKSDSISPSCKLSVSLEGLTSKEVKEIEIEIINMLDRNGFTVR